MESARTLSVHRREARPTNERLAIFSLLKSLVDVPAPGDRPRGRVPEVRVEVLKSLLAADLMPQIAQSLKTPGVCFRVCSSSRRAHVRAS